MILTFPSQTTRQNLQILHPYITPKHNFLIAAKGIEKSTGKRISEIILEELPNSKKENIAVLSGPNLAKEIYNGKSTSSVIASSNTYLIKELRNIIESDNFKIYSSKDMIGVDKLIDGIDLILSENFISETLKFGFDKTSYRAKLYDISIVESEKLHEEGYEISVRWSEKRRGEFFHYINSSEI